jgi:hypothetical protein
MEPFNRIKTEHKSVGEIEIAPDNLLRYKEKNALALMFLFLADAKMAEAEDELRKAGAWKLELKRKVNTAIRFVRGLTVDIEKQLDKDKAGILFFKDAELLGKMADVLMQCDLTAGDETKLLSYIKNNYGRRKIQG